MYLTENDAIKKIMHFFAENGNRYSYVNKKEKQVDCKCLSEGIEVTCLADNAHKNFLPWGVFWHAVHIMHLNGGVASRGDASERLGSEALPFSSVEGHVAHVVYGKQREDSVFRRISPIAHILIATGVCVNQDGALQLLDYQ
jgi:hypothetical protein